MIQADTRDISPEEVAQYGIGSILSGGGASASGDNTASDWADRTKLYQDAAINDSALGIPLLYGVDAVHGHNNVYGATIFPHNINLGQTGNAQLVQDIGEATAEEMLATGTNWNFSPTLGLPENERWGRTYECFSENIAEVTRLTSAYIVGLETAGVSATAKHFIGEGQTENGINQGNVDVVIGSSEYNAMLAELSQPYIEAIEKGVDSIMVSYNSIDGQKMHGSYELLTEYLRGDLGFEGIIISDYNGVDQIENTSSYKEQLVDGINAGIDVLMIAQKYDDGTPKWKDAYGLIIQAVNDGEISMARIDDAVSRILTLKVEKGLIDNPNLAYGDTTLLGTVGSDEHRALARQAVSESLVLLKNTQTTSGTTITDLTNMDNIFVAGEAAHNIGIQSGGWTITWQGSKGNITEGTTILEGFREVAPDKTFDYSANGLIKEEYDAAIVVVGEDPYAETDGDRVAAGLTLDATDANMIESINTKYPDMPIIMVVVAGRPITIANQVEQVDSIIMAGLPGSEGAGIADVLFGSKDFTGQLTFTWPWYAQDIESKFEDASKVLYEYGSGMQKASYSEEQIQPEDPSVIKVTKDSQAKIESESFVSKHNDIRVSWNGQYLEYIWEERYMDYTINVEENGTYTLGAAVGTTNNNKGVKFEVQIAGATYGNVSTSTNSTGGWDTFTELSLGDIYLPAGTHTIRIISKDRDYNIDYFTLDYKNSDYVQPEVPTVEDNVGTGELVKEDGVSVTMSSSENSQNMAWYAGEFEIENKNSTKDPIDIRNVDDSNLTTISIDDETEYQAMLGNGVSLEESTIYNLMKMDESTRKEFLTYLIDPVNGMGNTLIRLTVASSDFTAQTFYSYYDGTGTELNGKPDWYNTTGSGFSIEKDETTHVIQVVNELQAIAVELGVEEDLKFFASSWSPPGWMKTPTNSSESYPDNELLLKGGAFNSEYSDELATYFIRFLEEYSKHGINFDAVTLQNEPVLEINYPSCYMTGDQQAAVAKAFKEQIVHSTIIPEEYKDVAIWAFDHNFDGADTFMGALEAAGGLDYIDGIAFHPYGGSEVTMGQMYEKYPDLSMHLTERSVWGTSGANSIINWYRNGSQSYNSWVTMLDSNVNTHQWVGTPDPTLFVQDATDPNNYWKTPEVYIMSQFTKYIKDGYVRVHSTNGSSSTVTNVTYKNPETGELVMVVANNSGSDQNFKVVNNGTQFNATLPAGNVATYVWQPVDATAYKNITDDLKIADATVVDAVQGEDAITYITKDTKISYNVNVPEAGTYKFVATVAVGGSETESYPVVLSNGDKEIGQVVADRFFFWGGEWDIYTTYQTYVTFDNPGLQTISITTPNAGVNYKDVQFTKEDSNTSLPGRMDIDNYLEVKGLVQEEKESTKNFGYASDGDYIIYDVNVQQDGAYPVEVNAATAHDGKSVTLKGIDDSGAEIDLGVVSITNTGDNSTFGISAGNVNLTTNIDKIKVIFTSDINYRNVVIGNDITTSYTSLEEGSLTGKSVTATLATGKFIDVIDPTKFVIAGLENATYTVTRTSDTTVEIKFTSEVGKDFDVDKVATLTVDATQYNGTAGTTLQDTISVIAINDEESLTAVNEIDYNTSEVTIDIVGGTLADDLTGMVTLTGNAAKYVTVEDVTKISDTQAKVSLKWIPLYGDALGTITLSKDAYHDGNISLTKEATFKATSDLPTPITLNDAGETSLTEDMAYRTTGSLTEVDASAIGNHIDFYLDVKEAGDYIISYSVDASQGMTGALKVSGGLALATDNLASITFAQSWGAKEHGFTLSLPVGHQTIRLESNTAGFSINDIVIKKAPTSTTVLTDATTTISHDQRVNSSNDKSWYDEGDKIGFQSVGSYQDYLIDVQVAGEYTIAINAGTGSQKDVSALFSMQANTRTLPTEIGSVAVENIGWDSFANTQPINITLPVGIHTIRVEVQGDGFNYTDLLIKPSTILDTTAPVITANNATVYVGNNEDVKTLVGLSVMDNIDMDVTTSATVTTTLDTAVAGVYDVKITSVDAAGNMSEKTVTVEVVKPASIIVSNNSYVEGEGFDPLVGIKILDIDGTDITNKVEVTSNTVNMAVAGTYLVEYKVEDKLGTITTFTREVVVSQPVTPDNPDTVAPVITANNATVYVGDTRIISDIIGLSITDNVDGIITTKAIITTTYDSNTIGNYIVTVEVEDMAGNRVTREIQVDVVATPDTPVPLPETDVVPEDANSEVANTGDNTNIVLYATILVCSLGALIVIINRKRGLKNR